MTPLFWAKIDSGALVNKALRRPFTPSARIPPEIRLSYNSPETGCLEASDCR